MALGESDRCPPTNCHEVGAIRHRARARFLRTLHSQASHTPGGYACVVKFSADARSTPRHTSGNRGWFLAALAVFGLVLSSIGMHSISLSFGETVHADVSSNNSASNLHTDQATTRLTTPSSEYPAAHGNAHPANQVVVAGISAATDNRPVAIGDAISLHSAERQASTGAAEDCASCSNHLPGEAMTMMCGMLLFALLGFALRRPRSSHLAPRDRPKRQVAQILSGAEVYLRPSLEKLSISRT